MAEIFLRQELKLTQKLVMTQQLQLAIKLLQMGRLEMDQEIQQQLMENPCLEEDPTAEEVWEHPWWSHRYAYCGVSLLLLLLVAYLKQYSSSGRDRVVSAFWALAGFRLIILAWWYGPDYLQGR